MTASDNNPYGTLLLFAAAALFILLCPLFWISVQAPGGGAVSPEGENAALYRQIFPSMLYGIESLRTGKLPLWNNRILCGTPYFADGRHGLLQPLTLPFLFLDFPRALALHAFIALSASGFFFVLFARSLGLRFIPALTGALIAVCSGTFASAASNPLTLQTVMWFPLLLWMLREHMRKPRRDTLVLGALSLALLLLGGALMPAFVLALTALFYGALCAYMGIDAEESGSTKNSRLQRILALVAMTTLALLLFSIQGLPMLHRSLQLETPARLLSGFRLAAALPSGIKGLWTQLFDLQTQLLPAPGRIGVLALLLLPPAFFHRLQRKERFFFGLALPALIILALFTRDAGWVQALYFPVSFCLAVLAALGMDRLFTVRRNPMTPRLWVPAAASCLLFIILFPIVPDSARGRMIPFLPALVFFLAIRRNWAAAAAGIGILIFLYVDLASSFVNRQDHPFFQAVPELRLHARTEKALRESALDGRALLLAAPDNRSFHPNSSIAAHLYGALGESAVLSRSQQKWLEQWNKTMAENNGVPSTAMMQLMSVRAVAADSSFSASENAPSGLNLQQHSRDGGITVFNSPPGLSRAYWTPRWRLATDDRAALEGVCAPDFDPSRECLVTTAKKTIHHLARIVAESTEESRDYEQPRIVLSEKRPEAVSIQLDTPGPGILTFSECFDEGWHATDNGVPAPLLRVNGLFMGIALDKGNHSIIFSYRPPLMLAGSFISALTALFCVILLLATYVTSAGKSRSNTCPANTSH
ncbi:MAG TPA: YfhO family protein [Candidatus Hydrogenedentes bacterium]|nr:YfhO family protein [Candidatus Hydrogenedentota bacterium]